ncbi:MAG TPA: ABC transporter permease [Candidatus Saccharimonadales bacterium]|nr:ABC transporter permease [Candidatus Saccharimonadales bacterium]
MKKTNLLNLTLQLALTDFKLKYSGSVLGYVWSLVKPLLLFGVLYVIFTYFFSLGKGIPNYPVYLLVGIMFWAFFAEATMSGMHSIVSRGDLIRKINFPKFVIVLSAITTSLLTFALNLVIIFVFLFASHVIPDYHALLILPLVFELVVFILGLSLVLATFFTKFRDFSHIWEVVLQVGFYAVPLIYPVIFIPEALRWVIMLNPVTQIIQDARWSLISQDVLTTWKMMGMPLAFLAPTIVVVIFVFGLWFFNISAKSFAEEI